MVPLNIQTLSEDAILDIFKACAPGDALRLSIASKSLRAPYEQNERWILTQSLENNIPCFSEALNLAMNECRFLLAPEERLHLNALLDIPSFSPFCQQTTNPSMALCLSRMTQNANLAMETKRGFAAAMEKGHLKQAVEKRVVRRPLTQRGRVEYRKWSLLTQTKTAAGEKKYLLRKQQRGNIPSIPERLANVPVSYYILRQLLLTEHYGTLKNFILTRIHMDDLENRILHHELALFQRERTLLALEKEMKQESEWDDFKPVYTRPDTHWTEVEAFARYAVTGHQKLPAHKEPNTCPMAKEMMEGNEHGWLSVMDWMNADLEWHVGWDWYVSRFRLVRGGWKGEKKLVREFVRLLLEERDACRNVEEQREKGGGVVGQRKAGVKEVVWLRLKGRDACGKVEER